MSSSLLKMQLWPDLISQNLDDLRALLLEQDFDLTEAGLFNDQLNQGEGQQDEEQGEDYGSDDRPDLQKRPQKLAHD